MYNTAGSKGYQCQFSDYKKFVLYPSLTKTADGQTLLSELYEYY